MSETLSLVVSGMTCASCVGRVERAIAKVPGVTKVAVNLATESATITTERVLDAETVAAAVRDAGYEAHEKKAEEPVVPDHAGVALGFDFDTWLALAITTPLVVLTMLPMAVPWIHERFGFVMHFFMGAGGLVLALPVQLVAGRRFYVQAFAEVRHRALGMSTLVALGSSAAFLYSAAVIAFPGLFPEGTAHTYFEASTSIVTLVLVGKSLEARARGRTAAALTKLVALRPKTAHVVRDGEERDVLLAEVVVGDSVVVRPGETLPVDGLVISGESLVDESSITGEPMPQVKREGDKLFAGTQNSQGALTFRATLVGEDTTLGQVIRLVENAQSEKSEAQVMADRVAQIFVPIILSVALLTVIVWLAIGPSPTVSHALVAGVSVLVAACPCAMGLATPAALMVTTGRAAELGVLLRKTTALDVLARADVVMLDKTGTVTRGKPEVIDEQFLGERGSWDRVRNVTASVEAKSEHPIGRAVLAHVRAQSSYVMLEATAFEAELGGGVRATVEGDVVLVGTAKYLASRGVDTKELEAHLGVMERAGQTPVLVAVNGAPRASFAVADTPKPEAKEALGVLHELGIETVMATGDVEASAREIARRVGVSRVFAAQSPGDKAARVKELRASGKIVAFVGDGVNDAAALASADVGVAMGTGSDIAVEAGDVVLMRGDLFALVDAVRLSRETRRVVKQNFFWAYAYNTALVPLAAGALYPWLRIMLSPMLAATAMAASSLFVLGNSLRLRRFARYERKGQSGSAARAISTESGTSHGARG